MKKILLGLFVIVTMVAKSQVVPNIDWVKYYGNTGTPSLSAISNALDALNNIYVIGYIQNSTKDLVAIKYDSLGNQRWAYTYNNGGDDYGNAIVAKGGYVYITGKSYGTATTIDDIVTIKLDTGGTQQWVKRFNLANGFDEGKDIKIDASGNVYVAGTSYNGTKQNDIEVVKYTATGTQTWNASWNGVNKNDAGVAMVLSSNGNTVYVAGNKETSTGINDITVSAFKASSGGPIWTYTANGTANSDDESYAIILAGANVVACGKIDNTTTGIDYTTIKLNGSSGAVVFKKDYDNGNQTNYATALCRDSTGNIATVGRSFNGSAYDYRTVLYDSTGTQLWVNTESTYVGSSTINPKIATDTIAHHFYVSGEILQTSNDMYAYQITPTGNTTWRKPFDRGYGYDAAMGLSVNEIGVVHLTGITTNGGAGYDITTIRISQTPVYWVPDPSGETYSNDKLYYQNKGQLVNTHDSLVPQVLYYNQLTGPEYYIQKNMMSYVMRKMDTIPTHNDTLQRFDITYAESNTRTDVYSFEPTYTKHNYFLSQLDSNGITNVNGMKHIMIPNLYFNIDLHYYSNAKGIKYYYVFKPGTSPSTVKLAVSGAATTTISSGNLLLSNAIGTVNVGEVLGYQVIYTGGTYSIVNLPSAASWTTVGTNTFGFAVPSYSTNWPLVVMVSIPATTLSTSSLQNLNYSTYRGGTGNEEMVDVAVRNIDNTRYVVGQTNSNAFPHQAGLLTTFKGQTDVIIQKYTGGDTLVYSTFYGGTGADVAVGVKVTSKGRIFVVGNTTSLDLSIVQSNRPTADQQSMNGYYAGSTVSTQSDGFILELTNDGTHNFWSRYFGGIITENLHDVSMDRNDNLYFCGESNSCNYPKKNSLKASPFNCIYGTNYDWVFTKMDSTRKLQFSSYYGSDDTGPGTSNRDFARAIDSDTTGRIYIVGYNWYYACTSNPNDLVAINSTGNTGTNSIANPTLKNSGKALMRITPTYTIDLFTEIGATGEAGNSISDVKVLPDQTVLMCGITQESVGVFPIKTATNCYNRSIGGTNEKGFLCMIDQNINNVWTTHFSPWVYAGSGSGDIAFDHIGVSESNSFFISGTQQIDSLTMATTNPSGVYVNNTRSGQDGHISYFSNNAGARQFVYSHYLGGSSADVVNNMAVYKNQALYIVGGSSSSNYPIAGSTPLITTSNQGGEDAVITRFDLTAMPSIVSVKENKLNTPLNVTFYPNPVSDKFLVNLSEIENKENMQMQIHNMLGQLVFQENLSTFNGDLLPVYCKDWNRGLYIITINTETKRYSAKIIKD